MNWDGHKQLYEPLNLAKLLHTATKQWKGYVHVPVESRKPNPPNLTLIEGEKK